MGVIFVGVGGGGGGGGGKGLVIYSIGCGVDLLGVVEVGVSWRDGWVVVCVWVDVGRC